jgi:hypothetical protein
MDLARTLGKGFQFNLGDLEISTSYIQAGLIVFLLFLLVLSLAQFRRHLLTWSIKGALFGIFFGFLLALIFEGFLVIGGKTAVTELIGWKSAPKPLLNVLEAGRTRLVKVLGVTDEIPSSSAKEDPGVEDALKVFQSLDPQESQILKKSICEP